MLKLLSSQALLSFNMQNIDTLFLGFTPGDFAVMYGQPYVLTLSLLLAVRAQLPYQLGGLESSVLFVDGRNTFRLYRVSRLARLHHLRPRDVLRRIFISRAFTMHQMTSIIFDGLEEAAKKYDARLVIISDFQGLYMDKDVRPEESKEVFSQVTAHVSEFAKETDTIVIATCLPHYYCRRGAFLHAVACARSNVTIAIKKRRSYPFERQFALEKHPSFKLGSVAFPSENLTLNDFVTGV
jgi:predicted ATP-dependent serine protease